MIMARLTLKGKLLVEPCLTVSDLDEVPKIYSHLIGNRVEYLWLLHLLAQ
jgi:hypothetical protein